MRQANVLLACREKSGRMAMGFFDGKLLVEAASSTSMVSLMFLFFFGLEAAVGRAELICVGAVGFVGVSSSSS